MLTDPEDLYVLVSIHFGQLTFNFSGKDIRHEH